MSMNYYDSVSVYFISGKEQPFSLANKMYEFGDMLSRKSGMYRGKAYTLIVDAKTQSVQIQDEMQMSQQKPSCVQKIYAKAGACFKEMVCFFSKSIEARYLLVLELCKTKPEASVLSKYTNIILKTNGQPLPKKIGGEGYGNDYHRGYNDAVADRACADCCAAICQCCIVACRETR